MRARKKIENNKAKTTVGLPLPPFKPLHKIPPLTTLKGGGGADPRSPPPLWIRACVRAL